MRGVFKVFFVVSIISKPSFSSYTGHVIRSHDLHQVSTLTITIKSMILRDSQLRAQEVNPEIM